MINSDKFQRHQLEVTAGTCCSVHMHHHRANRFVVMSGSIAVVEFHAWEHTTHILTADMTLDIPSLVVHQFVVLEDGAVIEEYWADRGGTVDNADIVRFNVGRQLTEEDTIDDLIKEEYREHVAV